MGRRTIILGLVAGVGLTTALILRPDDSAPSGQATGLTAIAEVKELEADLTNVAAQTTVLTPPICNEASLDWSKTGWQCRDAVWTWVVTEQWLCPAGPVFKTETVEPSAEPCEPPVGAQDAQLTSSLSWTCKNGMLAEVRTMTWTSRAGMRLGTAQWIVLTDTPCDLAPGFEPQYSADLGERWECVDGLWTRVHRVRLWSPEGIEKVVTKVTPTADPCQPPPAGYQVADSGEKWECIEGRLAKVRWATYMELKTGLTQTIRHVEPTDQPCNPGEAVTRTLSEPRWRYGARWVGVRLVLGTPVGVQRVVDLTPETPPERPPEPPQTECPIPPPCPPTTEEEVPFEFISPTIEGYVYKTMHYRDAPSEIKIRICPRYPDVETSWRDYKAYRIARLLCHDPESTLEPYPTYGEFMSQNGASYAHCTGEGCVFNSVGECLTHCGHK